MTNWTRLLLVVLRVAIGWHFLFEGLEKIDSHHNAREGKPRWTSEFYLRGATGPLRKQFRGQLDDLDQFALERLPLEAALAGQVPKLPAALEKDWQEHIDQFVAHFGVGTGNRLQPEFVRAFAAAPYAPFPANLQWHDLAQSVRAPQADKLQLILTQYDLENARQKTADWFIHGVREADQSGSRVVDEAGRPPKVKQTTPQRIQAYRAKLQEIREIEDQAMAAFGKDIWKEKLEKSRRDADSMRDQLLKEADQPLHDAINFAIALRLTKSQQNKGRMPEPQEKRQVDTINTITMWGLTAVGVCLLLGLFTRLACLGGAALLLLFYLSMPPFPWLPVNPRAEGHYLFINKNLIEMIALLTLATTHSGRWLGLDGLIQFLSPWRWRGKTSS